MAVRGLVEDVTLELFLPDGNKVFRGNRMTFQARLCGRCHTLRVLCDAEQSTMAQVFRILVWKDWLARPKNLNSIHESQRNQKDLEA